MIKRFRLSTILYVTSILLYFIIFTLQESCIFKNGHFSSRFIRLCPNVLLMLDTVPIAINIYPPRILYRQ